MGLLGRVAIAHPVSVAAFRGSTGPIFILPSLMATLPLPTQCLRDQRMCCHVPDLSLLVSGDRHGIKAIVCWQLYSVVCQKGMALVLVRHWGCGSRFFTGKREDMAEQLCDRQWEAPFLHFGWCLHPETTASSFPWIRHGSGCLGDILL